MAQLQANEGNDYIVWIYNADTSGGTANLNTNGGSGEDTIAITLSGGDDLVYLRDNPSNPGNALMTINTQFELCLLYTSPSPRDRG